MIVLILTLIKKNWIYLNVTVAILAQVQNILALADFVPEAMGWITIHAAMIVSYVTYAAAYTMAWIKVIAPQPLKHFIDMVVMTVTRPSPRMNNGVPQQPKFLRYKTVGNTCSTCGNYGNHMVHLDSRGVFFYCTECTNTHNFMDGHFRYRGVVHTIYRQRD